MSDAAWDDLPTLLTDILDEEGSEQALERLHRYLSAHPEASGEAARVLTLHALLLTHAETHAVSRPAEKPATPPAALSLPKRVIDAFDISRHRLPFFASIVAGTWLLWLLFGAAALPWRTTPTDRVPAAQSGPPVARLTRSLAAHWAPNAGSMHEGGALRAAHEFHLTSGLAEIEFQRGAVVTLQGPAKLEITGANAALLSQGRLAATVPPRARGFTIETPKAAVIDLGTEFGVAVEPSGAATVHVFHGSVLLQTAAPRATPQTLLAGQTLRVDNAGATVARPVASSGLFVRNVRRYAAPAVNLLVNGDFDEPQLAPDGLQRFEPGSRPLPGWKVLRGMVAVNAGRFHDIGDLDPSDEQELMIGGGHQLATALEQRFTTLPGRSYFVKFDLGLIGGSGPHHAKLRASVQSHSELAQTVAVHRFANSFTRSFHLIFTADAEFAVLRFEDLTEATQDFDLVLDNVYVTPLH